jgi:OOP family OmpA-OmpF porin
LTVPIDLFPAPATRLGLLALLALMVLGLSVLAVPAILDDEPPPPEAVEETILANLEEARTDQPAPMTMAGVSAEGIVLEGTVTTEGQRDALVDASRRRFGPDRVEDRLEVLTGSSSSAGMDNGVVALQSFIAAVPDGVAITATATRSSLALVGEAHDDVALAGLHSALEVATAASPGTMTASEVVVPPPPPPTPEELTAAAQSELDSLNDLLVSEVLFATGSNEPTAEFTSLLDRVPDLMDRHPSITLTIVGHTDDRGSAGGNLELSGERAAAAMTYLVGLGVDADRLAARGAGETEPIDTNTTRDGRARNRRVELIAS